MYLDMLTRHRRALHKIPELKFDLPKTQAYVIEALKAFSCEISTAAEHGVLAYFDNSKPSTVAFRTDMDALPVAEVNTHEYVSSHPGCMHACGHDGHMAIMLTFAHWVNENLSKLDRNVLLIFQPAEESGGGGEKITDTGVLVQRNVERIFALHVEPSMPVGTIASRPGPFFARASEIHLDIIGAAGHAATPGAGKDALAAAVDFVYESYKAEKELPAKDPRRLKFCMMEAGTTTNIVAGESHVKGTLRTYAEEDFDSLFGRMSDIADEVGERYGVTASLNIHSGYPALINDAALYEKACGIADITYVPNPYFLGEDFSYYTRQAPAVLFQIGLGTGIPLHSSNFDFDEKALETGLDLYIKLAETE